MKDRARWSAAIAVPCMVWAHALPGCAWTDAAGRRHHLILGLGVVTTAAADDAGTARGASIEGISATGAFIGTGPVVNGLMLGWVSRQTVQVEPGADVLIEARSHADGTLSVLAQSGDEVGEVGGGFQKGVQ